MVRIGRKAARDVIDHPALLAALLGDWTLDRVIAAEGANMAGSALFTPEPGGTVLYREEGTLRLSGGRTVPAYRHYRFRADRHAILIDFADGPDCGNHFVTLRFAGDGAGRLVATDVHPCRADRYDVTWRLDLPGRFETDITAFGPRYDYRAVTRYRRT